ncbi:MAG: hypothetical protein GXP48_02180 [Acidobacteria bacterium]|nr:hypothetical protein [Acidobacteriota bacterium]
MTEGALRQPERCDAAGKPPRGGCLRAAAGAVFLVLLAPWAALVRTVRASRRGRGCHVRWQLAGASGHGASRREAGAIAGDESWRLDLEIDAPLADEARVRTDLIDTLVRVAETLRRPDDVYNLVVRQRWDGEPRLIAVGPSLQRLAHRLERAFSHRDAERCTHLWLTLPVSRRLGQLVDPEGFDPEAGHALDRLIADTKPRWAAATSFGHTDVGVLYRVILAATGDPDRLTPLFARLQRTLEGSP